MISTTRTPVRAALTATGAAFALVGLGVTAVPASAADTGIAVLEAIKQCESGGSYTAQNPTSTASGAYQFLDSTWQSMDAAAGYARAVDAPEAVQDAAAVELYTEQGTTPWLASASCWQAQGYDVTTGSGTSSAPSTDSDQAATSAPSDTAAPPTSSDTATGSSGSDEETPAAAPRPGGRGELERGPGRMTHHPRAGHGPGAGMGACAR